jgi:hypothetical protein
MARTEIPIPRWIDAAHWSTDPADDAMVGGEHYLDTLKRLHKKVRPKNYLEIGVREGHSLALASCASVGIDPEPQISVPLKRKHRVVTATSDDYFAASENISPIDLAFIDGMHLAEFALRDFINVEMNARPGAVVVVDDIFPNTPAQAERARQTRVWMGDIWKLPVILEKYRPDLSLTYANTLPSGLLIIRGLDPSNSVLPLNYDAILDQIETMTKVPSEVLLRTRAVAPEVAF